MKSAADIKPLFLLQKKKRWRFLFWLFVLLLLLAAGVLYYEVNTSRFQAQYLPEYAKRLTYSLEAGPSHAIHYPMQGPFDQRLGYTKLPAILEKVQAKGLQIEHQVRFSVDLMRYVEQGYYPPYNEKNLGGLSIFDHHHKPIYLFYDPKNSYASFEEIPHLVVAALLFIENRQLLDSDKPNMNPAIEWERLLKAAVFKMGDSVNLNLPSIGASTLATQIEKYRHSEAGITDSVAEKWRQMVSASVRIYQQGSNTLEASKQLVVNYLNTVPLAAAPGYGEVNGLADGLRVWFGSDFTLMNQVLKMSPQTEEEFRLQAFVFKQVLALMIAHRRPSFYLLQNQSTLTDLTNSYLRVFRRESIISPALATAGLKEPLSFRDFRTNPVQATVLQSKGTNVVRNRLVTLLEVPLYDLDRMDLRVVSTLERDLQASVTAYLQSLRNPDVAKQHGLIAEHLLQEHQTNDVRYSFTLFERTEQGNLVRVQTDNTDMPFDINEGSKLELGSTAKLRVLATYLELISEIFHRYQGLPAAELNALSVSQKDVLTYWVLTQLRKAPELSLSELLNRALDRSYSANPNERFFTGGGNHTFSNFRKEDNARRATMRESFRESLNLPFVRLMKDIVRHITYSNWQNIEALLKDNNDPRRRELLSRFIDRESTTFLSRFWNKYQNKNESERLEAFLQGLKLTPDRLAIIHRYLYPHADFDSFAKFLKDRLNDQSISVAQLEKLFKRYEPGAYNLQDLGYLARVHPLELWLLAHLIENEKTNFQIALEDSLLERQQVYSWLLRTKAKNAQDNRILTMMEVEAFSELHQRWKNAGYPFAFVVPSLASALGSSGDRPAALAELMGIIMNDGARLPVYRLQHLAFAEDTPYETHLAYTPKTPVQVMHPEVAAALRSVLADVVNAGTGRRLQGVFKKTSGAPLIVGGKTGTGDNRLVVTGVGGQKRVSRALNRTATFVFYIGERHYGTLTAFVPGDSARHFQFTSALPVQVLKSMAPILAPYVQPANENSESVNFQPKGHLHSKWAVPRSTYRHQTQIACQKLCDCEAILFL